jgi:hypothetical protein
MRTKTIVAAGVVLIIGTALAARQFLVSDTAPALRAYDGSIGSGSERTTVGTLVNVGFTTFQPQGKHPVRVQAVRVTGVPDGLRVVKVLASHIKGEPTVGADYGDLEKNPTHHFFPVTAVTFEPGQPEDWYLVVTVAATRSGTWKTEGLDIDWTAGHRHGTTHYRYWVGVTAS